MSLPYLETEPRREDVDAQPGAQLLEFGTPWCGWCRGAQPAIEEALRGHGEVRHLKIEDGPGRPLGRSFRVKLWPTLVMMRDGREVARLVRPSSAREIADALAKLDAGA